MKNIEYLYFCDGKACEEKDKQCCFTNGDECHHTTNEKHALSKAQKGFPPTIFRSVGGADIMIERLCEDDIFNHINSGEHLTLK